MKILLLTDGITPYVTGGMQKHSFMLAKYLAKQGVQIELHHCVYEGELPKHENLFEFEEFKNIKVVAHHFPSSIKFPGHYIYRSYLYSKLLFEEVKNKLNDFDFIYAKGFTAWKLMQVKKQGLKYPPIGVKFHGYEMFQKAPSFKVKLEHYLLRPFVKWNTLNADIVFSYGGKITQFIKKLGVSEQRILEIPSGIEEDFVSENEILEVHSPRAFCFIGRYERRKGIEELTEALKELIQTKAAFVFHFIGPIPLQKQLKDSRIIYHGQVTDSEDKKKILDQCDVLVCPSHSEGMPNVILEAMARGLAILATDVGAVNKMVHLKNGWLISQSSPKVILEKLKEVVQAPENQINELKKQALTTVIEQFTWLVIGEQTAIMLKNL